VRPVCFAIGAWVASRHERRFGSRRVQVTGGMLLTAGSFVTAIGAWWTSLPLVIVGLGGVGWGVGYSRPANTTAVTNAVDESDVGVATGVLNMTGQIGSAVGITVLLAIIGESGDGAVFATASLVATAVAALSIATAAMIEPHRPRPAAE
jgi:MFS family permease